MPSKRTGYAGRVLSVKPVKGSVYTWSVASPRKRTWAAGLRADVFFLRVDEMNVWEADRPGYLPIPAGFWELQKNGTLRVMAPAIGYGAPFRIPPGLYHIVVGWGRSWAATRDTVEIPRISDEPPPSAMEIAETAERAPDAEFRREGTSVFIRHRLEDSRLFTEWERISLTPRRPPPRPPRREGKDKVDPFPDVQAAMPVLVSDIQRARHNIWIAWWALEDDFPTQFNPAGVPIRFFRDEIKAALRANLQLQVYMIVWTLPGWPTPPDPAQFCFPVDQNRLHINWQTNDITGSHHQKFLLADLDRAGGDFPDEGAVLWCRGWDGLITYWDIHSHADPDPYLDVAGRPHQPWHDSAIRVISERSSRAFENEFRRRWALGGFVPPLPAPPPTFIPRPVGRTMTVPLIHIEFTRNGPEERWYLVTIPTLREGLYIENQYFDDVGMANSIIGQYLATERAGRPIHGAVVICHPEVLSPFFLARRSRKNIALIRATTARSLALRTAAGIVRVRRPPGGWTTVAITAPLPLIGSFFHVRVTWPGGAAAGDMERAVGGIVCLTMVTPSATAPASFRPVYLHSKFAVMDTSYILGSTNISFQSFHRDSEADIVVPDLIETKRVMRIFFPNLVGGGAALNLAIWVNRMATVAASNYDMEKGTVPWAPVGLLTEFPYE